MTNKSGSQSKSTGRSGWWISFGAVTVLALLTAASAAAESFSSVYLSECLAESRNGIKDDDGQPEDEDVQILDLASGFGLGDDGGLRHDGSAASQKRQERHDKTEEDQLSS